MRWSIYILLFNRILARRNAAPTTRRLTSHPQRHKNTLSASNSSVAILLLTAKLSRSSKLPSRQDLSAVPHLLARATPRTANLVPSPTKIRRCRLKYYHFNLQDLSVLWLQETRVQRLRSVEHEHSLGVVIQWMGALDTHGKMRELS